MSDDPFDVPLSASFNRMLRGGGSGEPAFAAAAPPQQQLVPPPPQQKPKCPPWVWALVAGLLVVLLLVSIIFIFVRPNKLAQQQDTAPSPPPPPTPALPVSKLHQRVLADSISREYYNHALSQGLQGEDADIWAIQATTQYKMQQQQQAPPAAPTPQPQRTPPPPPPPQPQMSLAQMLTGTNDASDISSMVSSQTRTFDDRQPPMVQQPVADIVSLAEL